MVSGSLWSIFGEVTAGGARALSYFIYAKLLSPTDFGLIGFCLLLISLFPMVIDNSLGLTLIRQEKDDQHTFSVLFFLNVGLTIIAIGLLNLGAGLAADFLHDRRVMAVLPIMSTQLICNALCSIHIAIARRKFRYRSLVPIRLLSAFCSLAVGLPLAYLGYGYWSLVAGSMAAAFSQMVAAWAVLRWHPSLEFDWRTARSVTGFTSWVALDMAITWAVISGGGLFLAFFLGAHDLGVFRLSDQINAYVLGAIFAPLIPVFYSAYCEVSSDAAKWQPLFGHSVRIAAMVSLSLAAVIVAAAHPLEAIVGGRWHGVGTIVAFNAIADGISYAIVPIPALLRAQGRAKVVAQLRVVLVIGQLIVYSLVASHGLQAFVIGKICLQISMYLLEYAVLRSLFDMPVLRLIRSQIGSALAATLAVAAAFETAKRTAGLGGAASLAVAAVALCIPLGGYIFLVERRSILRVLDTLTGRRHVV